MYPKLVCSEFVPGLLSREDVSLFLILLYPIGQPRIPIHCRSSDICVMKVTNETKAAAMRSHIEACSKSGLAVTDYCKQNRIVKSSYYYWHKKLSAATPSTGFTSINVTRNSSVEIIYPNGVQLSYAGDINTTVLKSLICCI